MSYIDISSKNHTRNMNRIDDNQMILCDDNKSYKFTCEKCEFKCNKLSNYNLHLSTMKHKKLTNQILTVKMPKGKYKCSCGKEYKHASTLSKHKKQCSGTTKDSLKTSDTKILVEKLLQQQKTILGENKEIMEEHIEIKRLIQHQEQNNKQLQEIMDIIKQATAINN